MSNITIPNFVKTVGLGLLIGAGIGQYQTTGMIGPVKTRTYYLYRYYDILIDEWLEGDRKSNPPKWPSWEELPPEYKLGNLFCWQPETGDNRTFLERFKSAHKLD